MSIDCHLLSKGQTLSTCKLTTGLVQENTLLEAFVLYVYPANWRKEHKSARYYFGLLLKRSERKDERSNTKG